MEENDPDSDPDKPGGQFRADLSHEVLNEIFKESTLPSPDVRVAMMGTEGSGKTCLGDTLTGETFKDRSPAEGPDEMEIIVKSAVDWSLLTKEEMISNLQQQVLQEVKHSTVERSQTAKDFKTSTTVFGSNASLAPSSHLQKAKSLPMLELRGGDKMYILTNKEFKQLPSMLEKYDPLRRYVNIWDYAGQQVFQHTQGLFLSEEMVCLIVFDATKLLDEVPERRYKDDTSPARSGLDTITYWMDLISCRVSKKSTSDSDLSEFLPTFILVGTKIDLLSPDINKAEQIALQKFIPVLKKNLAGKPFAKHIAGSKNGQLFTLGSPSIFFLSNCNRNVKVVSELQHVILQAAPMKSRPTRLVKMERKLMLLSHDEKLSVVDIEQIKEVANSCGISSDHEGILKVLNFFHQKGTLLYFHQVPALSNMIILCPQWLAKLLTYVLTNLICQPAGPPLAQYAEERNKKGLLRQQLLNFCVDAFLTEESRKGFKVPKLKGDDVVDLLLKFKLMVDVTNTSPATTKTSTAEDRIFLVPHLLPVQPFAPVTGPCYKVFYLFTGHFIPDDLVNQLIVKCAEWNKQQKFIFLRLAYQWISMGLGLHQSYQLRPIHKSDLIELTIVSNPKMPPEEEITAFTNTNKLITVVKTFIDDLMQECMTATFEQYPVECYLPCPACSEVHVELEEIKQNSLDFCPTANVLIDMTAYHKMLLHKSIWTQHDLKQMVSNTTKQAVDLPESLKAEVLDRIIVLLVTIDVNETLATQVYLQQFDQKYVYKYLKDIGQGEQQIKYTTYYIGKYGLCPVAICEVSPGHPNNLTTIAYECFPNLSTIINVGITCGVKTKVAMCDVLVSSKVVDYHKGNNLTQHKEIKVSNHLIEVFKQSVEWPSKSIKRHIIDNEIPMPSVKFGEILCSDNLAIKTAINNIAPAAIGLEMGGAHLLGETQQNVENIIIVKAVCDLEDEKNDKTYQPIAALLAVDLVHKCLSTSRALEVFTAKQRLHRMVQQAKNDGLIINVRHAKILFCGASRAGKTNFCRLLRNKSFQHTDSTNVGESKQVLISEKVSGSWDDLDGKLQTEAVTKLMILMHKLEDKAVKSKASAGPLVAKAEQTVDMDISSIDSKESSVPKADSEQTGNNSLSINQNATQRSYDKHINAPTDSELIENMPKNQSPVPTADEIAVNEIVNDIEKEMSGYHNSLNISVSELKESISTTYDLFTLMDTGGQPEFVNLLPAINTFTAITFIVLNMSEGKQCLGTPVVAKYERTGYKYNEQNLHYKNIDLLQCFLSAVRSAAMQEKKKVFHNGVITTIETVEPSKPVACIIGTHADTIKENFDEVIFHVNNEISKLELIKRNDGKVMDIWSDAEERYLRPVDNTVPRDSKEKLTSIQYMTNKTVDSIRNRSKKLLEENVQYEIPISWFILEWVLRTFCKKNEKVCISIDHIETIYNKIIKPEKKMEKWAIKEIMKFYHMLGTLLFYDEVEGMNEFVIVDPQWLFTNLSEIVKCTFDNNYGFYKGNDIKKLRNTGICSKTLLKKLKFKLHDIKLDSFLNLLAHLKVIAPKDHDNNEYFIPSVLPRCNCKVEAKAIFDEEEFGRPIAYVSDEQIPTEMNIAPLLIQFDCGTIPRGLFAFLAVQLLQDNQREYKLYSENDPERGIYYCCDDLITLQIDPYWYVTLIDNISYLELQVRVQGYNNPSYHWQVQKTVSEALKEVCDQFDWNFTDCRYGFSCKKCNHISVLCADKLIPLQIPVITKCSSQHRMDLKKEQKIWFEDVKGIPRKLDDKLNVNKLWTQEELQATFEEKKDQVITLSENNRERVLQNVVVLLVTMDKVENMATNYFLEPLDDDKTIYRFLECVGHDQNETEYYIGKFGSCLAAVRNYLPSLEVYNESLTVPMMTCKSFPNLGAVIGMGVAYGVENKVKLCDVLVSTSVINYHNTVTAENTDSSQNEKQDSSYDLIKLFRKSVKWPGDQIKARIEECGMGNPKIQHGKILSVPGLTDDSKITKRLLKRHKSEVIGIEMKRTNLFPICQQTHLHTIIVNAVCDFGDGNQIKIFQPTAALLAANCISTYLNDKEVPEMLKRKATDKTNSDTSIPPAKQPKISAKKDFCSIAAEKLTHRYVELSNLPYPAISGQLFANHVITIQEKLEIDKLIGVQQMQRVLDIVIHSLYSNFTIKYKGFLNAMKESDDETLKIKAKELILMDEDEN